MSPCQSRTHRLQLTVRSEWSREEEQWTEPGAEFLPDLIISTTKVSLEASWDLAASALITDNKVVAVRCENQMRETGVLELYVWSAGWIMIRVILKFKYCRENERVFYSALTGSHLNLKVCVAKQSRKLE